MLASLEIQNEAQVASGVRGLSEHVGIADKLKEAKRMMFEFIFDDGRKVNVSEHDWIGELMHYDLSNNVMWMK